VTCISERIPPAFPLPLSFLFMKIMKRGIVLVDSGLVRVSLFAEFLGENLIHD